MNQYVELHYLNTQMIGFIKKSIPTPPGLENSSNNFLNTLFVENVMVAFYSFRESCVFQQTSQFIESDVLIRQTAQYFT